MGNHVHVHGGLKTASITFSRNHTEFPTEPPTEPTTLVQDGIMYYYGTVNGLTAWHPMHTMRTSYVHTQQTPAETWTVQHDLNTKDVIVSVYNSNDELIIAPVKRESDGNTITIAFDVGDPRSGYAVVFSAGDYNSGQPGNIGNPVTSARLNASHELEIVLKDGTIVNGGRVGNEITGVATDASGLVTITMADGSLFSFMQQVTSVNGQTGDVVLDIPMHYKQVTKLNQTNGQTTVIPYNTVDPDMLRDVNVLVMSGTTSSTNVVTEFDAGDEVNFDSTPGLIFDGTMRPDVVSGNVEMVNDRAADTGRIFSAVFDVTGLSDIRITEA